MSYIKICRIMVGLLVLLGLVGCKSSPLTVTFKDNECTLNGPTKFSDKKFNLVLVIDTKEHNGYGLGIYTLAEGKTVEDLKSLGFGAAQPDWANLVLAFGPHPSGTYTYTVDPYQNSAYQGEPLYFICVYRDTEVQATTFGYLGPVEVKK